MYIKRVFFINLMALVFLLFQGGSVDAQTEFTRIKKLADSYLSSGNYQEAGKLYERLLIDNNKVDDVSRNAGITYYHLGALDKSKTLLSAFLSANNKDLSTIYYLAKIAQQQFDFGPAIDGFKNYLRLAKSSDNRYKSVIDDIKRSHTGMSIINMPQPALVENLGQWINSSGDEFGPVWSPNHSHRMYFTSDQLVDTSYLDTIDPKQPRRGNDYNMFGSSIENGMWSSPFPLNMNLNTSLVEQLYGFDDTGFEVYYSSSADKSTPHLWINIPDDTLGFHPSVDYAAVIGMKDPLANDYYFFNDSILLFSSIREGGYGGYDLYVTYRRDSVWSTPENLGATINSNYDERYPFLAHDGRTLIYSANNLKSIGGFDLLRSKYDDKSMSWGEPVNMGIPFNSASNDIQLAINSSGQSAVFASDRPGGYGGYDLYSGYFKSLRGEQGVESNPIAFVLVPEYKLHSSAYQEELRASMTVQMKINPLYYTSDESLLQAKNKVALDDLAALAMRFPGMMISLLVYTSSMEKINATTDMFFGIKRLESIVNYLATKGISPGRIISQSVGGQYPIAKNELGGKTVLSGINLNNRVEIKLRNIDSLPLVVDYVKPVVNDILKVDDNAQFHSRVSGLSYRIQVITLSQMYKGDIFAFDPDILIESQGGTNLYKYLIGIFSSYKEAKQRLEIMNKRGLGEAYIVPYINNIRVTKNEISPALIQKYPDLQNFILF